MLRDNIQNYIKRLWVVDDTGVIEVGVHESRLILVKRHAEFNLVQMLQHIVSLILDDSQRIVK